MGHSSPTLCSRRVVLSCFTQYMSTRNNSLREHVQFCSQHIEQTYRGFVKKHPKCSVNSLSHIFTYIIHQIFLIQSIDQTNLVDSNSKLSTNMLWSITWYLITGSYIDNRKCLFYLNVSLHCRIWSCSVNENMTSPFSRSSTDLQLKKQHSLFLLWMHLQRLRWAKNVYWDFFNCM